MSERHVALQGLLEVRAGLERAAFHQACRSASDREIAEFAANWAANCEASLTPEWGGSPEAEEVFQLELARLSGNAVLVESLRVVNALIGDMAEECRRHANPDRQAVTLDALQARDLPHGSELRDTRLGLGNDRSLELRRDGSLRILFGRVAP